MGNFMSVKREFGLIVVGSVVFTASLLWNDYLSTVRDHYFPKGNGMIGGLIYTILLTIILVMIVVYLKQFWGLTPPTPPDSNRPATTDPIDKQLEAQSMVNLPFSL